MLLRRTLGEEPAKVQPQPPQPLQPAQPLDDDTKDSHHLDTEEVEDLVPDQPLPAPKKSTRQAKPKQ